MAFSEQIKKYSWAEVQLQLYAKTALDVEQALAQKNRTWQDFLALLSPAAEPYLEAMAKQSHALTLQNFGRCMHVYVPMYLSNKCANFCTYCGFSIKNKIKRLSLTPGQILTEAEFLLEQGHQQLLLVTGETSKIGVAYIEQAIELLSPLFSSIAIETQAFELCDYQRLRNKGLHAVTLYQETYNLGSYQQYHLRGNKADYWRRLDSHDKTGAAGVHKLGLGVLLGLDDWRVDSAFTYLHLKYLENRYWRSRFSISFPRLRNAEGYVADHEISDKQLVQLLCAYRLCNPFVELNLSTRESANFRKNVAPLGVTHMSAGARTSPGAYSDTGALEQFEICDQRPTEEVAASLRQAGFDVVFKDWYGHKPSIQSGINLY
ncbi:2-iminoacetate synthase ThiH [Agaribacterium haliotis]|uniref:2-iminoacetate synthase ThiH n=1 Tax=Agaribacterium haliotis TaxID=2013869 RepID=UPI000BB54645|nr:2-iminoacetate synthase ThiH [Agaribacterium haliotis]